MKQENIDKLMGEIDRKCKFPKHWNEFIENNSKNHHIIIKDVHEKNLYCTNCNKYFVNKEIKVRDYVECPHCKTKSEVCGMNFYRKSFEQSIVLVQRMNKQVIIRVFEIYSYFEKETKKSERTCIEYARIIHGIGKFLGNNVYINMFGVMRVYHNYKKLNWYEYKGHKYFTDCPTYPYDKKRLIKGTNMEYAPIEEFMDRFSYYRYNFLDVLELAAYESFEMLWKLKLYNLCFYSKALNRNGSFYKRFKVPKNFLKFMQDNNISYKELMILQLFQKEDKKLIQKYRYTNINSLRFFVKNNILDELVKSNVDLNSVNFQLIKEISKYVPLKKLMQYQKGLNNLHIYRDYLKMAKELALNYKSNKDLFPRNLVSRHDKLQKEIKIIEDMSVQFAIYLRYLELSKYTYEDEKYIIFPAPSIASMQDEGEQQGNCVGYMYLNPYKKGETEIYFIRNLDDVCKSFITLEYKNGKVIQKELPYHSTNFTNEQNAFIDKWLGFRNFIDKKEKYKNKTPVKTTKYDITHIAA